MGSSRSSKGGKSTSPDGDEGSLDESKFYKPRESQAGRESSSGESLEERSRLRAKGIVDAIFKQQLPLQSETSFFILVNMLDFFMTYLLLNFGAIESNPLADFFFKNFGFRGMLYFKLASVAFICILTQIIAKRNLSRARFVLLLGTAIVGFVVIYSAWLLRGLLY
ncbi:MAG: DUF5658 family protein [Pirellulaceae bacterium]